MNFRVNPARNYGYAIVRRQLNCERTNNKQIIFPKVPSFGKLTAVEKKEWERERRKWEERNTAENDRSAKSLVIRVFRREKQNKKQRGGKERKRRRLENLYFPTAFYRPHSIPLKMKKKEETWRDEGKGEGGSEGRFFSNSTLFCVIQPLPSCRCFTSGRWSYSGWTFCPLQFISWKLRGRRKAEEHSLSVLFRETISHLSSASRLVAREKLRTMPCLTFRWKNRYHLFKREYLISHKPWIHYCFNSWSDWNRIHIQERLDHCSFDEWLATHNDYKGIFN